MELLYNASEILQERYPNQEDLMVIPIAELQEQIEFLTPKMKEIAQRRESKGLGKLLG